MEQVETVLQSIGLLFTDDTTRIAAVGLCALALVVGLLVGRLMPRRRNLATNEDEVAEIESKLIDYRSMNAALDRDDDELWRFRPSLPPRSLLDRLANNSLRVVTLANLKGGVGKTTSAANLAAALDHQGFRVLVIDLDYQGSLSAMMLRASNQPRLDASMADEVISGRADGAWIVENARPLTGVLDRTRIITAGYTLARVENRMMLRWLARNIETDIRYNLLEALMHNDVQGAFDIVLIDAAPRLTTGTINALLASSHFVVPTILDDLSTETLPSFLRQARTLFKEALNPNLELAGVLATMTDQTELRDHESMTMRTVRDTVREEWGPTGHVFETTIPDRVTVAKAAGKKLAFVEDPGARAFFEKAAMELRGRIGR